MDKTLTRLLAGLLSLAFLAFLLSLLLPASDGGQPESVPERVVTMDLTQTDSQPQESMAADAPPPDSMDAVSEPPEIASDGPASTRHPAETAAPPEETPARSAATPAPPSPTPEEAVAAAEPERASAVPADPAPAPVQAPPPPKATPRLQSKPTEKRGSKPAAKPAPGPAPIKRSASGNFAVQGGAYSFLDKAETVRAKARALGVGCVVSPGETTKGVVYRLRCGPYASLASADAAAGKLSANGIAAQVIGEPR